MIALRALHPAGIHAETQLLSKNASAGELEAAVSPAENGLQLIMIKQMSAGEASGVRSTESRVKIVF